MSLSRIAGLVLLVLSVVIRPAQAQSAEDEVLAVVEQLFDAMRAGDSTAVRAVFHPQAALASVGERDGAPALVFGSLDDFARAVGTPHDAVFDERIWDPEVRVDGAMATAWTPYAFYLGDTFSHCGVNAFQLFRGADGWQIVAITDTRRRAPCDVPASVQQAEQE